MGYFDFISFVQYASISDSMRRGRILFEELQDAEGTAVLVRRDPALPASNADLPVAHAERVGNALLDWLTETYPGIAPKPPTSGGVTKAALLEDIRQFAALLEIVETSNHRFRQRALQRMATRAEANLKMMRSVENVERELIRLETIRREPKGEFLTDVQEFQTAINEVTAEAIVLNALKVLDAKLEMTKSELDIVKSEMDTAGVE